MNAKEIAKEIINGNFDRNDISTIIDAIKTKQSLARSQRKATVMASLEIGSTVKTGKMTPRKYSGMKAEVTDINKQRVTLKVIESKSWEVKAGEIVSGFPMSALEVLD